jgi:hypothetical protein
VNCTDPQRALESIAGLDPSGLCAAEAARLADPPAPPAGWDTHPLTGREQAFFPSDSGITVKAGWTSAIIRHPAEMTLTPSLRLRWSWRVDTLPSRLPEDTASWRQIHLIGADRIRDRQKVTGTLNERVLAHWAPGQRPSLNDPISGPAYCLADYACRSRYRPVATAASPCHSRPHA